MLQIPRSDIAAEEGTRIERLLSHTDAIFAAEIIVTDSKDVSVRIEAQVPNSDTLIDEALFQPEQIPSVMLVLYRQHEVTRALADYHNRLAQEYSAVESRLTQAVINGRA